MADQFNPLNLELTGIDRQRQLAQALLKRGMEMPESQMVSGRFVGASPVQYLANLFNQYVGQKGLEQADVQQQALADKLRQQGVSEVTDILTAAQGRPELPRQELAGPAYQGVTPSIQYPAIAGNTQAALAKALNSVSPQAQSLIPQLTKSSIPEQPTSMREFAEASRNPEYARFLQTQNQAKGTNISVNTGQHGFDNALKLRSDFRAEPVYKGFEETKAAKNQIDQAAKMASPAGDLAAATKIMKILDPGSVVRESELGMAMAATGVEDRVKNYANMVITGEKLTPAQRKDFIDLSNKLYNASAEQFNQKRNEYAGIADRNKLDVEAAVGAPAKIKANTLSSQDQQALQWANSNPTDPRAAQIKKRLGQQ